MAKFARASRGAQEAGSEGAPPGSSSSSKDESTERIEDFVRAFYDVVARADERFAPAQLVRVCWGGLSMGDHYAADIAQESHEGNLRRKGCLRPEERMAFRHPLPFNTTL